MTDDVTLVRGLPERDSIIDLLNEAYDDWGDEQLLRWKYDQYPNYKDEHGFAILIDGDLAAFRRVFDKEIVVASRSNYRFFALGDTSVSLCYRGEGLYSRLHAETTAFCKKQNRDFSCTFNRIGNVTYKANLDRGWLYRTLPVNLRILSPESVLPRYAQFAIEEGIIYSLLDRIGHRIGVVVGSDKIHLGELVGASTDSTALYVPLPERLLAPLVEVASSTGPLSAIRRRMRGRKGTETSGNVETSVYSPRFDEEFVDNIYRLYESKTEEFRLHFRRDRIDIRHMLSHPYLESIVVAEDDGKMVGFAPICLNTNNELLEAQVLDLIALNDEAFEALIGQIETIGVDNDADLVIAVTESDPGPAWARIDRQVMMWDEYDTDTSPLLEESLLIGLYDVV